MGSEEVLDTESLDLRGVLEQIKELESQGFTFEGAEASVELMLRRTHPAYVPLFEVIDYSVNVQQRRGPRQNHYFPDR